MTQANDCKEFGYTWVYVPDDSVVVVKEYHFSDGYPAIYKVVPKPKGE